MEKKENNYAFIVGYLMIPNHRKYSALLRKFRKYFVYLDGLKEKLGKLKERE
ncbi:MAG: hypothetical protein HYT20_03200 [Candidatus Nealsonbacteria bacterium]|nr:hypothetical protein [Candidatus Nealsonbacteria bacterium]